MPFLCIRSLAIELKPFSSSHVVLRLNCKLYADFRTLLMVPSGRPALPDKIVGIAVLGKPYPGSGTELLVGTLPHLVKNQGRTDRDDERGS